VRLFIAIDFSEEIISAVSTIAAGIKAPKWVSPEQLHLTLKFIGDYPDDEVDKLISVLRRITFPAFSLTLSGTGFFPGVSHPQVFWLGVESSAALNGLKREIEDLLAVECNIGRDEREFIPHVTLARFNRGGVPELTARLREAFSGLQGKKFSCDKFTLFSSRLTSAGAIHQALANLPCIEGKHETN